MQQTDSYAESNISYVTGYACACDVNKYGVTSHKKHSVSFWLYKTLFF